MGNLNRASKLKIIKSGKYQYLYLYFKLGSDVIRYNTKLPIEVNGMTRENLFSSSVKDYQSKNKRVLDLKDLVDKYIKLKLNEHRPTICQKELKSIIHDPQKRLSLVKAGSDSLISDILKIAPGQSEILRSYNLLDHYDNFYKLKSKDLDHSQGMKHYKSLQNALIDYQTYIGRNLTFDVFNSKIAIYNFRDFLISARPNNGQFLSKGSLANNTIRKRLSCLYRFFRFLEKENFVKFKEEVFEVKIDGYVNDVIFLTNEEIRKIYEIKTENPRYKKIIDVFVCNCYMGLRFSDLNSLEDHDFYCDDEGTYFLKKTTAKTGVKVQVPIQPLPLQILKSYNFSLPKFSNQHFNRELKKILTEYKLFFDHVTLERKVLKQVSKIRKMKRDLISSHTCRRTFITLALKNNIPVNAIMMASGHKKLSTVQKYIGTYTDKSAFEGLDVS